MSGNYLRDLVLDEDGTVLDEAVVEAAQPRVEQEHHVGPSAGHVSLEAAIAAED